MFTKFFGNTRFLYREFFFLPEESKEGYWEQELSIVLEALEEFPLHQRANRWCYLVFFSPPVQEKEEKDDFLETVEIWVGVEIVGPKELPEKAEELEISLWESSYGHCYVFDLENCQKLRQKELQWEELLERAYKCYLSCQKEKGELAPTWRLGIDQLEGRCTFEFFLAE